MAHPTSGNVYCSVMRGSGDAAVPVIIRVSGDGSIGDVPLDDVAFSQYDITDAAAMRTILGW